MTDPGFDADSLFRGAARLGLLLGALDLPWERVAPFVAAFPGELSRYVELSVDAQGTSMGLMTRGEGLDFTHRVTHFMETHGVAEERLRHLLVTARFFEHKNLFFKVEAGRSGVAEMSWYLRRRPELDVVRAWLEAAGVPPAGRERVDAVARALGKRTAHFLAASEIAGGASVFKVYLSQPDAPASFARLEEAARLCGIGGAEWAPLAARRDDLAGHTAFLSVALDREGPRAGAKIDVRDVEATVVAGLGGARAAELVEMLLTIAQRPRVDYAGFRLAPGAPLAVRAYAIAGALRA